MEKPWAEARNVFKILIRGCVMIEFSEKRGPNKT